MRGTGSETDIGTGATRAKGTRRRPFGPGFPYQVLGRIRKGVCRQWIDPRFREASRLREALLDPGPLDAA